MKIKNDGKEVEFYGKKSLNNMMAFILGYTYRKWKEKDKDLVFLDGFDEFVLEYYGLQEKSGVFQNRMDIINFFSHNDEEALENFYKLLEMFLISKGEKIDE